MASRKGVMLGVPDEMVNSQDDSNIGWMTNKFGGLPVSKMQRKMLSLRAAYPGSVIRQGQHLTTFTGPLGRVV